MDEKKVRETIEDFKEIVLMSSAMGFDITSGQCDLIIEALEKQLPKRVNYEGAFINSGFTRYQMAKCPTCERWYSSNDEINYCSGCGQKLDWSE